MFKIIGLPILLGAAWAWSSTAMAEESLPTLRWEEVEARLNSLPEAEIARWEEAMADREVEAVQQWPNPEVGFALGQGNGRESDERRWVWEAEAEWTLPSLGTRSANVRAMEAEAESARERSRESKRALKRRLRELFWTAGWRQQAVRLQEEAVGWVKKLESAARMRVERGEARPMELSRIRMEAARVEDELESQRTAWRNALAELLGTLDWSDSTEVRIQLEPWDRLKSDKNDLGNMDETDPSPIEAEAEARLAAAEAKLEAARWERLPEVTLGLFYEKEMDADIVGGRAGIALPLWNFNGPEIDRAELSVQSQNARLKAVRRDVRIAIENAQRLLRRHEARSRRYEEVILLEANQTAKDVENLYRIGEIGLMDALDAQRSLMETKRESLEANHDYRMAWARFEALIGDAE